MNTNGRKIGYAVAGLGIGKAHADAAAVSENARLVAVCDLIDEAIARLGMVVAELIITVDDIENESLMSYNAFDGITAMGKALATLVRWFDDD